jgi:hypothetical protein
VPLGRSDRKRTRTIGEQYLRRPVELKLKATCMGSVMAQACQGCHRRQYRLPKPLAPHCQAKGR